jgi:NAD(P)-dependent dehydrogenase (short-subunit alcohol dehydrogenase family)
MAILSSMGTALVTAATGTVGRAIVGALAPRWGLVLQENSAFAAQAEELARSLRQTNRPASVVLADLQDVAATNALLEHAGAAHGPVTLLVNAATAFEVEKESFNEASWARLFGVNVQAPWQLARCFAAALPPQANGAIVNIADRRLWPRDPCASTYELSQAALCSATETMARAYAPRVRVNAVGPGKTIASGISVGATQTEMPLTNPSAADAIARAVLYLATAGNITGQVIAVHAS